jgi:hypothetical protein
VPPAPSRLPLPTLLSHVLVAYTMEFDNLAELRLPHHTNDDDRAERADTPWLVSYVCWANVLDYVGPDGLTVATLRERARTDRLLLEGLCRWRYLRLIPARGEVPHETVPRHDVGADHPPRPPRPRDLACAALPPGRALAQPLRRRCGRSPPPALATIFTRLPRNPPAFLPVVYPTQNGKAEATPVGPPSHPVGADTADLVTLLAGVLLSFTTDFEAESRLSLPISANTLRVLGREPRRLRDLPRLTGGSKESNAMCMGFLERRDCAVIEPDPAASRGQVIRLTDRGVLARAKYERLLAATEES